MPEGTFLAHLAVTTNAGQLKVGAFARSERVAKKLGKVSKSSDVVSTCLSPTGRATTLPT